MRAAQTSGEKSDLLAAYFRQKNVLVTGGMGFIGSHLALALLDIGAFVTVLDVRTDPTVDSLLNDPKLGLRKRIRVIHGDLVARHIVQQTIEEGGFHVVFNLAAFASVIEKAAQNPLDTIEADTISLLNLLESIRSAKRRPLRVVHASTDKIYGELEGDAYEEDKTPLRGMGVYDCSKLAADLFTRMYHEAYDMPTVVLRMCNVFGPADFSTDHRVIPRAMRNLFAKREPKCPDLYFGSLDHWRDYLYVDDCVRALLLVAFAEECRGDCFNVSATQCISTPDLLKAVIDVAYEVEREYDEWRAEAILAQGINLCVRAPIPGALAIRRQHLDGSKLARVTGFAPTVGLREGLDRTARAYREFYVQRRHE